MYTEYITEQLKNRNYAFLPFSVFILRLDQINKLFFPLQPKHVAYIISGVPLQVLDLIYERFNV